MSTEGRRWIFADQLGEHFLDAADQPVLLIESRAVLRRRKFHRQKAHLVLSALRHRAAELGDRAAFIRSDTYSEALARVREPLTVCRPTSHTAADFVAGLPNVTVLEPRGFASTEAEFARWAQERRRGRLLMEDFYRDARRRLDVLMEGDEPVGGRWNLDTENRQPPPPGGMDALSPWRPTEDEIDEQVRHDLSRWERDGDMAFVGRDAPRAFPATRAEALAALEDFTTHRLPRFGPHQDAMLADDPVMAHSLLSAALNLGLLGPMECVRAAEAAYLAARAPLASVEGYIRQVIGWRDYIWHLYWHLGPSYREENRLAAELRPPEWFRELDAGSVQARCLSWALEQVRDHAFTHHIVRLMVLGNYALQRGFHPGDMADWFHRCFVDGYDWVMIPNVVGMSQYADGGTLATKPYAAGGAYINRMSDFCGECRYRPTERTGEAACPFTAGYWWFLARNEHRLKGNHRVAVQLKNLHRLSDIDEVCARERDRGTDPP
ncbi:cryptochrome/photolyase family protein [Nonomuraea deserti]|uniref:Cryptochrome/photolyase family protein n=1 Tax=Nonomuraea deserti TaxID=1848322 RepID=A0A4R4W721_9ACTN|nr:cryptochrome/photolyase family protein [Nonomuraea deserti]TDD10905.1 cryptochrome/photolyase family protein [Nonomuraea deserti]